MLELPSNCVVTCAAPAQNPSALATAKVVVHQEHLGSWSFPSTKWWEMWAGRSRPCSQSERRREPYSCSWDWLHHRNGWGHATPSSLRLIWTILAQERIWYALHSKTWELNPRERRRFNCGCTSFRTDITYANVLLREGANYDQLYTRLRAVPAEHSAASSTVMLLASRIVLSVSSDFLFFGLLVLMRICCFTKKIISWIIYPS